MTFKTLLLTSIAAVGLAACSSANKATEDEPSTTADTEKAIDINEGKRYNILSSYIENRDSVFGVVNDSVVSYIASHGILTDNEYEVYIVHDSITHLLFDYNKRDILVRTTSDRQKSATQENILSYLLDYLSDLVYSHCNVEIRKALEDEELIFQEILANTANYMYTHCDFEGYSGYWQKYYDYPITIEQQRLSSLLWLYSAMVDNDQTDYSFIPIPSELITDEQNVIRRFIDTIDWGEKYDRRSDKVSFNNLADTWHRFFRQRKLVSSKLPPMLRVSFDNGTYLMQKQYLIDLKNDYEQYDAISHEAYEKLYTFYTPYNRLFIEK